MQQTICREFKNCYNNSLLQNTNNVRNIIYSFIVTIFVILNNPQITKARSENFKSEITKIFRLSMWVEISEAIRMLSTCLLISLALRAMKLNKNNRKIFDPVVYLTNDTDINSGCMLPTDTKINTNLSINNNNNSSPKFTDGNNANSKAGGRAALRSAPLQRAAARPSAFNEWLAGLIDGDGCFQLSKKGYSSLEIVMELRDKHCLYQIKDKFGGSVKLRAGDNHLRYRLHHKTGMLNLINSINGLIRNPARILQLGKICDNYGIKLIDPKPLTYNNGWFAGFFDSDGSIYMNDKSGQLFITASQKNRFILDALVELYGGTIYPMVKVGAFKWTCFRKDEVLSLVNTYFKANPCRSEKKVRLSMANKFYELRALHAHKATPDSVLGKVWINFTVKWDKVVSK
uniref:Homing endonuclease LAGLIDADG domain-containing protein n=1 Tax=Morchella importuna TaxID=1174673 RepID=A0A650AFH5_9PEZI|nr:hypothetical protein [Morchella importuna]QGN66790.1 hypothetical protein [Morchella importuna]